MRIFWQSPKEKTRRRRHEAVAEALADVMLDQELAGGKEISSIELPCLTNPEDGYWRDRVRVDDLEDLSQSG